MKLLLELNPDIETIVEASGDSHKNFFIHGIFMQSEIVNANGRTYPRHILEREVDKYNNDYVKTSRALGELNHRDSPNVDPALSSHLITELKFQGNDVYGKAKILNHTPNGKILRGLIEDGVRMGVSSRALGTVKRNGSVNEVQSDLKLCTIDAVHNPSAPNAFVNGIMEEREWVFVNNSWMPDFVEKTQKQVKNFTSNQLKEENSFLSIFESFMKQMAGK